MTVLSDDQITSDAALAGFDTLVIGIFALRFRAGLVSECRACGTGSKMAARFYALSQAVDNWDPETVPPRRLEIGQRRLRWRVTDAEAQVTHLTDHPLLSEPNRITDADWQAGSRNAVSISPRIGMMPIRRCCPLRTPVTKAADRGGS